MGGCGARLLRVEPVVGRLLVLARISRLDGGLCEQYEPGLPLVGQPLSARVT